MKKLIIEDETTFTVNGETFPRTEGEKLAFGLGRQLARIQEQLDRIEAILEVMNKAAETPEQKAFESRVAGSRLCCCRSCVAKREAKANEKQEQAERDYRQAVLREA